MENETKNTNTEEKKELQITGFKRAVPIILFAAAAFIALCFITKKTGIFGAFISEALLGLFSIGAYLIPVLFVIHGVFYYKDLENRCVLSRAVFSIITVLTVSALAYTIHTYGTEQAFTPGEFFALGKEGKGGGFIGGILAFALMKIFGSIGLIVIAVAIFALYVSFFFAKSKRASGKFLYYLLSKVLGFFAAIEKGIKGIGKKKETRKEKKPSKERRSKNDELFRDSFFEVDNGMQELSIPKLGIKETRSAGAFESNPTLHERVHHKSEFTGDTGSSTDTSASEESQSAFTGRKSVSFDYGAPTDEYRSATKEDRRHDDIIIDNTETEAKATSRLYGLDENADDVFTKDFNPFDFAENERLARKASSRSESYRSEGLGEIEKPLNQRPIDSISEEEVEAARRRYDIQMKREAEIADFEAKKRAALEHMRRQATPATNSGDGLGETKSIEINVATSESIRSTEEVKSYHTSYDKSGYSDVEDSLGEDISEEISLDSEDIYTAEAGYTEHKETTVPFTTYEPTISKATAPYDTPTVVSNVTTSNSTAPIEKASAEVSDTFIFAPKNSPQGEEAADTADLFKPYEIPVAQEAQKTEEELLRTERSMLDPVDDLDDEEDELPEGYVPEDDMGDDDEIIPEEERNPLVSEQRKMFPILDEEDEDDEPPFEADEVKEAPKKPSFKDYKMPPIDLLSRGEPLNESTEQEIQENTNRLIETLASFNVTVSIKGVDRGPRITRYEVVPGPGVKVTQVTNLENDIKLYLAAEGMRIKAPIPGKSAIGIEIPNKKAETVRLRDLIETEDYTESTSKTLFCVGKDVAGMPVFNDIEKMPHMLVAGATGMGKSVFINSMMISLLYKARPDEVRFIMIDPKKLEFNMYNGIPHLLVPVVTDPKQAAGALMWAVEQMEKRYEMIGALNVRNITAYNEKVRANPKLGEPMTRIIIVIDEFADLMLQVRNPVENLVMSIAQKARAAGIHLVIGTQRPSVNVLTGVIKANIPSRFTCKVVSNVDSRTILEQAGAEKLLNKGDMLYLVPGMSEPERVQSAYVSDKEVEDIMEFLKSQSSGSNYDAEVLEEINRQAQRCSKDGDDSDRDDRSSGDSGEGYLNDKQFLDAVEVAVNTGKISTSLLQRKISIGFGKAAKFIDIMEDMGVVSGPNGQKPRDVLMTPDEWHEKLARTELD